MDRTAIRQIGRYRLIDVIGQGGMGVVYRAVDESIDRPVAIKMLLGGYVDDKDLLARFHREVRSTANLQHKNIVTVYALDDFEGFPYMVMEYLEGQSMSEMISSRRQLNIVEKLRLVGQVCEGLQYAHERNIIHRDIKPANIIVLKNGTAKIVDFGIARMGRNETHALTHTGQIIGSLYYMSPEQLSPSGIVDARSDIYSTGATLYQFLTGELPFKSGDNDPSGTILKILNDPVPSLGKYLKTFPTDLDEILRMAMAKEASARYQTAEDFGDDLTRMQESLRHEMITEFLAESKQAIVKGDLDVARQKLQEILRFEKRNAEASELFQVVREQIQRQQRSVQIAHFKSQAQIALAGMQYEEALECIEQARRLDPDNPELTAFIASIRSQVDRARELTEALGRGQAALYAGDLDEAGQAVQRALQIDDRHTEARALEGLIQKELGERSRRARLQTFVEQARREISDRNYLSALHALKEAHAIDPSDSNIQELLSWAQRGHEQEKLRNELHQCIDEVGRHIAKNRHLEALASCENALQRFPNDPSLVKLQQLAQRQKETAEQKRAIEEVCARARRLTDEEKGEEAVLVLEDGLEHFPDEPTLLTLLVNTRSENERRVQEKGKHERQLRMLAAQSASRESSPQMKPETLAVVTALQSGMSRNISMAQLSLVAEQLRSATAGQEVTRPGNTQVSLLLSEFELRLAKWKKDLQELEKIADTLQNARELPVVDSLDNRARFIRDLHEQDEEICASYEKIRIHAEQLRIDRERVNAMCLESLQSIHGSQNLQELAALNKQLQEASTRWVDDPVIRSLVNQISAQVEEVASRKKQVLEELNKLESSFAAARSAGQIRLLEQQARMLAADFTDADVDAVLLHLYTIAHEKVLHIEQTLGELKELSSKLDNARMLEEIEQRQADANSLLLRDSLSEEATDLLKRILRQGEEKRREYGRVQDNLNQLIGSAENARDQAELDLILARRRDLLKRYSEDPGLRTLEARLDRTANLRREALKQAADAQAAKEKDEEDKTLLYVHSTPVPTPASVAVSPSLRPAYLVAGALGLAVLAIVVFVLLPKSVSIVAKPADATVTVDSESCGNPCTRKLTWGRHTVEISRAGFADVQKTFNVAWNGAAVPVITLAELPKPPLLEAGHPLPAENQPQLVVRTSVPGVSVFLDSSHNPVGITDASGELQLAASAQMHQIRVEKNGFEKPAMQTILVKPGGQAVAWFNLTMLPQSKGPETKQDGKAPDVAKGGAETTPSPQPQPEPETFLVVQAPPGAEIHIDQQLAGHSTGGLFKAKVKPGSRTVEVFLAGYEPYNQVVPLSAGQQIDVVAKLTPVPAAGTATTPPNVAAVSPSAIVSDEDRRQIQQLLDRYADGFSRKDIRAIQSCWPSIPSEALRRIRDFFKLAKSVNMSIRLSDAIPAGKRVTADYIQTLRYSMEGQQKSETASKTLYVIKTPGGWSIDFIPTS
jgi:serine/threonine protein kinase